MFCPKCGSLLIPKKVNNRKIMACSCGYKSKKVEELKIQESNPKEDEKRMDIVEKEVEAYPLTKTECPKCHHKKAYFWTIQTRAGDEPETKFFKCEACKHTWRDYN